MTGTQKIRGSILWSFLIILISIAGFHSEIGAQQGKKAETLKVALLPILDAFPFYVAESEGYFVDYGVDIKAVPVASGLERDQLMQSGAIDGMLNEMITTANFNRNRHSGEIGSFRTQRPILIIRCFAYFQRREAV